MGVPDICIESQQTAVSTANLLHQDEPLTTQGWLVRSHADWVIMQACILGIGSGVYLSQQGWHVPAAGGG